MHASYWRGDSYFSGYVMATGYFCMALTGQVDMPVDQSGLLLTDLTYRSLGV